MNINTGIKLYVLLRKSSLLINEHLFTVYKARFAVRAIHFSVLREVSVRWRTI
jgi:hypothetical protein